MTIWPYEKTEGYFFGKPVLQIEASEVCL